MGKSDAPAAQIIREAWSEPILPGMLGGGMEVAERHPHAERQSRPHEISHAGSNRNLQYGVASRASGQPGETDAPTGLPNAAIDRISLGAQSTDTGEKEQGNRRDASEPD